MRAAQAGGSRTEDSGFKTVQQVNSGPEGVLEVLLLHKTDREHGKSTARKVSGHLNQNPSHLLVLEQMATLLLRNKAQCARGGRRRRASRLEGTKGWETERSRPTLRALHQTQVDTNIVYTQSSTHKYACVCDESRVHAKTVESPIRDEHQPPNTQEGYALNNAASAVVMT